MFANIYIKPHCYVSRNTVESDVLNVLEGINSISAFFSLFRPNGLGFKFFMCCIFCGENVNLNYNTLKLHLYKFMANLGYFTVQIQNNKWLL